MLTILPTVHFLFDRMVLMTLDLLNLKYEGIEVELEDMRTPEYLEVVPFFKRYLSNLALREGKSDFNDILRFF